MLSHGTEQDELARANKQEREALDAVLCWVIDGMANTIGELTEEDEEVRKEVGIVDGWLRRVKESTAD